MEYKCELIRDLLPLYHDGVCSRESAAAVEEHLAHCEACRDVHQALLDAAQIDTKEEEPEAPALADSLKKVKFSVKWKRAVACLLAVLIVGGAATGTVMWLCSSTITMPEDLVLSVWKEQRHDDETRKWSQEMTIVLNPVYLREYNLDKYGLCSGVFRMEIDGKKQWIMACSVWITRWDHLMDQINPPDESQLPAFLKETIPVDWEHIRNYYDLDPALGESPGEAFSDTNITRLFYFPEEKYFDQFVGVSPQERTEFLENHAVQVWRDDGEPVVRYS